MQLSIDTSTNFAGLALSIKQEVLAEITWRAEQNHTVELLPNLVQLLYQTKKGLESIDGISVAVGPGSYNGLRVGLSTAKGLALALNVPLVGVGTLEVEAYPYFYTGLPICPVHDAGRREIAAAVYRRCRNRWRELQAAHITTIDVLCSKVFSKTIFCGEMSESMALQIMGLLGSKAVIPEPAMRLRRVGYLALLGWQRLAKGDFDDSATLQPLYLRRPAITQPRRRIQLEEVSNVTEKDIISN